MKTKIEEFDWQKDWIEFVQSLACVYVPGMDDDELTQKYAGNQIMWKGKIEDVQLDNDIYRFLGIGMPAHEVMLSSGRVLRARRLVIPVHESKVSLWEKSCVGMDICFTASIGISDLGQSSLGVSVPARPSANQRPADLNISVYDANPS